jgi:hypothetical protein
VSYSPLLKNLLCAEPFHVKEIDNFAFSVQPPSPPMIPGNNLAPVIGSDPVEGYDDVGRTEPNPSFFRFAHIDEWAPPCSPVSPNPTDNLPTAPAVRGSVSYPDPNDALYEEQHAYQSFPPDATQTKCHIADCSCHFPSYIPNYSSYSQHNAYSSQIQLPVQPTSHGVKGTPCFLASDSAAGCHARPNTMAREDLDFSMFMALGPPYSL